MSCPMCGGTQYNDSDFKLCDALGISICKECTEKVEKHHKVDGRFKVIRCKECKQVREIKWTPYKKKGRKKGHHNRRKLAENQSLLAKFFPPSDKKEVKK